MQTKLEPGTEVTFQTLDTEIKSEDFSGKGTVVADDGRRVYLKCQGGNTIVRIKDTFGALRVLPPRASSQ